MKSKVGMMRLMGIIVSLLTSAATADVTTNASGIRMERTDDGHESFIDCWSTNKGARIRLRLFRDFKAEQKSVRLWGGIVLWSERAYDLKRKVVLKTDETAVEVEGHTEEIRREGDEFRESNIFDFTLAEMRSVCRAKTLKVALNGFETSGQFDLSETRELRRKFGDLLAGDHRYSTKEADAMIDLSRTVLTEGIRISNAQMRVTERNSTWWKYAWQVTVQNATDGIVRGKVVVQFTDKDGFVVDDDIEYDVVIGAKQSRVVSNYDLIDSEPAPKVARVQALWRP